MVYTEQEWFFFKNYLDCCKHLSWSPTDEFSIRKLICVNLRTTEVMDTYEKILHTVGTESLYYDPKMLLRIRPFLEDSNLWIYLMTSFYKFKDVTTCSGFNGAKKPLMMFSKSLEESGIVFPSWCEILILYILVNIDCVPSANICQIYVSRVMKKEKTTECILFLQKYADMRQTREEYINTFSFLMNECFTEEKHKKIEMVNINNKRSERDRDFWAKKTIEMNGGRLRLRERLKNAKKNAGNVVQSHETFDAFQDTLSFSSHVSYNSKLAFYFLACQQNVSLKEIMETVQMRHVKSEMVSKLTVIKAPELNKIQEVIAKIRYFGAPEPLITEFYDVCLRSVSLTTKNTLSLSTIIQLYICIYQNEVTWKECWTNVLPIMNAQVIRDIETFRKTHPSIDKNLLARAFSTVI